MLLIVWSFTASSYCGTIIVVPGMIIVRMMNANKNLLPGNRNRAIQNASAEDTTADKATVLTETRTLLRKLCRNLPCERMYR